MIVVKTKYVGATNFRGARMHAICEAIDGDPVSIMVSYRTDLSELNNHLEASRLWFDRKWPSINRKPIFVGTGELKGERYHLWKLAGEKMPGEGV